MYNKMSTNKNQQLSLTTTTTTTNTKQTTRARTESEKLTSHEGFSVGLGRRRMAGKGTENKKHS